MGPHRLDRRLAIAAGGDDGEIRLERQQGRQAAQDDSMVLRDDDPDWSVWQWPRPPGDW
jgi:hypothetical protein